ncbi:MAG: aldo/keto reductase [Kiritimatiellia bacterium]
MKKYPYTLLLADDKTFAEIYPAKKGHIALFVLDEKQVLTRIDYHPRRRGQRDRGGVPRQGLAMKLPAMLVGCMPSAGPGTTRRTIPRARVDAALRLIDAALEAGLTAFDHADIYCRGKSETVFGLALKQRPALRDHIFLQSKCGIRFANEPSPGSPQRYDFSREHILASVDGSLRRLQTDRLDALPLHRPDALAEPEEIASAFDELRRAGKVLDFGVSNHNAAQMERLAAALPFPLLANQLEFSLREAWNSSATDSQPTAIDAATPPARAAGHLPAPRRGRTGLCPLAQGRLSNPGPDAPLAEHELAGALHRLAAHRARVDPETVAMA